MVSLSDGKLSPIFPFGRKPLLCAMPDRKEVILLKNNQGICVDQKGKPSRSEPIEWAEGVSSIIFCRPYVIALESTQVDVRNIHSGLPVQKFSLKNATMLATTRLAERMLIAANHTQVMQFTPVSPSNQVDELVAKGNFEAALQLVKEDLDSKWVSDRKSNLLKIRTQYGYHLYNKREFARALSLFQQTEINPRQVLALFPRVVPTGQCKNVYHPVDHVVPIDTKRDLTEASAALIPYVEHLRNRLSKHPKYYSDLQTSQRTKSSHEMPLPVLVDCTMVLVLLQMDNSTPNRALLSFLCQDSHNVDLSFARGVLKERAKFQELIELLKSRDEHNEALKLLEDFALSFKSKRPMTKDKSLEGPNATIAYLQFLVPLREYQDLVLKFSKWVVKEYPMKGLSIFTVPSSDSNNHDSKKMIPPRLVLKLLRECSGPDIVVAYLEKYLEATNNTNEMLHNQLVFLYLDLIRKASSEAESSGKKTRTRRSVAVTISDKQTNSNPHLMQTNLRNKLIRFLQSSKHYKPQIMLARFPVNELLEERAVLLSRLKEHREALSIYVWRLNQNKQAIRYCAQHFNASSNEKNSKNHDIYLDLMNVFLTPPSDSKEEPQLDAAMNLLGKNFARMNIAKAVEMLPDDLPIDRIYPILKAILSHNKTRTRRNQVTKSLYRIENLRVRSEYIKARSRQIRIDDTTLCTLCHRRIMKSAFVLRPRHEGVVHYMCAEKLTET